MKKRVLIAEDDANVALLFKEGLADLGADYEVETVGSGEAALEKLDQTKCDVLVTDYRMPGMTGLELIQIVQERMPSTSSILISGYGSKEVELAAERLKVFHYMSKPFPLIDLKRAIDHALAAKDVGEPTSS